MVNHLKAALQCIDKCFIFTAGILKCLVQNRTNIRHHIICICDRTETDTVGILCCRIKDLLSLLVGSIDRFICLCIRLLHDLMLCNQLLSFRLSICNQTVSLGLCILKDCILITDNLLITFDLIRSFQTKFT